MYYMVSILTNREREVIDKKIRHCKLTQQDSNYLSKYVRPKLREMKLLDAKLLLDKLEYNQKTVAIENKIKKIILENLKGVELIILYGSAIQTNYKKYNDVDVMVITKKKTWKRVGEKYREIFRIKKKIKKYSINLDLELYDKKTFYEFYNSDISLAYQLKESKVIYGNLDLPSKLEIPKINLRTKLDYSIVEEDVSNLEIYKAIRNLILLKLALNKIIDNKKLIETLNEEIGKGLSEKLKEGRVSAIERKIALLHLKRLLKIVLNTLERAKWEKIVLLNH